ncbi:MAG TPA: TonB family protein [Longimicrobium sp.]|jgi:TonB family protein
MIRTVLCAAALLCAAPPLYAQQCTWEADQPRGRREAQEAALYRASHQAQRGALQSALRAAGVSDPKGLVIVTTERGGGAPVIRSFDLNFPTAALGAVAPVLAEHMKELPERQGGRVASVLRLDTTALPPARADGRRRDCRPVLLNRDLIVSELQRWAASTPQAERVPRPVLVGIAVSRDGRVLYAEVARSSGSEAVDRFALELAERLSFRAATLDGVTRDVWAVLPITIR